MRIPQAIFTSIRGERLEGYQLAAKSDEIPEELARELTPWGPAHDSLLKGADEPSVNFHPLSNDRYCLSLTSCGGAEYSGRSGGRVYTQMFVLPQEALRRFDNNPLLILRAIEAAGRAVVHDTMPPRLWSFPLVGRAGNGDLGSLESLLSQLNPESLSGLAEAVLDNPCVAVSTPFPVRLVVATLLHLLPAEERLRVSFTTGLRHSPRRPFRLFLLPDDPAEKRQLQRQSGMTVVEVCAQEAVQEAT